MSNIVLHPAVRQQLEARLAEAEAQLAVSRGGHLDLLRDPKYLASTTANARRIGVDAHEMHRRGVDNFRIKLQAEIDDIRAQLRAPDAIAEG